MADPLEPEQTQEETLPSPAPEPAQTPQPEAPKSLDQFLYGDQTPQEAKPSTPLDDFLYGSKQEQDAINQKIPVAQHIMALRDDPAAIDPISSIYRKITEPSKGEAAWADYYNSMANPDYEQLDAFKDAESKNNWGKMAQIGIQMVGKDWGNYISAMLGLTDEDRKKNQESFGARMAVGTITDPKDAATALQLQENYQKDLQENKSLAPEGQKPAMSFGTGQLSLKVGMNLSMADEYLKNLQDEKTKAFGKAALRNFAVQSGDAFIPFVSVGDIIIDEKNPDQVARRAALANAINQTISEDYFLGTVAGQAAGSLGGFMAAGSLSTKLLGRAAQVANAEVKVPTLLSQGAMYGVMGTSQSVKTDTRNLSPMERFASIMSESLVLGLSEKGGDILGEQLDNAVSGWIAASSLEKKAPAFIPVAHGALEAVSVMVGESASDQLDNIMRGQNPFDGIGLSYATNFGVGAGLALAPGIPWALRKAKILANADRKFSLSLGQTFQSYRNDPRMTDDQRIEAFNTIRNNLVSEKARTLADRLWALSGVNEADSPESHAVLTQGVKEAEKDAVESELDAANAALDKQKPKDTALPGTEGQVLPGIPVTPEQEQAELERFKNFFETGGKEYKLQNTPENAEKIKWLESKGAIYGNLTDNDEYYVVKGVRMGQGDLAKWYGEDDPKERFQDEKFQLSKEVEKAHKGSEQELNVKLEELDNAATYEDLRRIAMKNNVPLSDYEQAIERSNIAKHDRVDEELALNNRVKKLTENLAAMQKLRDETPEEERFALDEGIAKVQAELQKVSNQKQAEGQGNFDKNVKDLENQADTENSKKAKSGELSKELEENPEVVLAILNPKNESNRQFKMSLPSPVENDKSKLGEAFNLEDDRVVANLQRIGALDEAGRPLLSPAEAIVSFINDKLNYLNGRSLSGYRQYNIADQVYQGFINKALLELRKGNKISLSTIFNSQLYDFIRKAKARMKAGVGIGGMETLKEQIRPTDAQSLIDELGMDENQAELVKNTFDEIEATEAEWQATQPGAVPTPTLQERIEVLAIIASELVPGFRQTLKSDIERLAFDSLINSSIMSNLDAQARKLGSTVSDVKVIQDNIQKKLIEAIKAEYRNRLSQDNLPTIPSPEGEVKKAGNLTSEQILPTQNFYNRALSETLLTDAEKEDFEKRWETIRSGRRVEDLRSFQEDLISLIDDKLGIDENGNFDPAVLEEFVNDIAGVEGDENQPGNLRKALASGIITQKEQAKLLEELIAAEEKATRLINEATDKKQLRAAAREYRATLVRVNDRLMPKQEGEYEKPKTKIQELKPAEGAKTIGKLTPGERKEARRLAKEKQAAGKPGEAKEAGKPGQPAKGTALGRGVSGVLQRIGAAILPKKFTEPKGIGIVPFDETVVKNIGINDYENALDKQQRQDIAAAIASLEGSKNKSFYLANGAGTGKTRVLLAIAKHYLNQGKKVIYLTAHDAVTPDWRSNTIGGTIQKDSVELGVPIIAYGGKESKIDQLKSLPEGVVTVSTYNTIFLDKFIPMIDKDTVVLFDEHHNGRNLFSAKQEGRSKTAWPVLMEQIADKAGYVMMASGTPFDRPDQLLSLKRLGIFNNIAPEQLLRDLGFQKYDIPNSKKSYWDLAAGVSLNEMQSRLEKYIDGLAKIGIFRSRSLMLDGINVDFKNVALDRDIKVELDDISNRYGGDNNQSMQARMKAVTAQKRALEKFKVKSAARQAVDSIKRGVKPIVYVGFVSEKDTQGNDVDQISLLVEQEIKKLIAEEMPQLAEGFSVARLYSQGDGKQNAIDKFNNQGANVLIATTSMGGTGIELDDKAGDQPREMIIMSPPISAISAVQLIYRVWRTDSASRPRIVFLTAEHQVDQEPIDRMRQKMRLLDAVMGAGFEGLKGEKVPAVKTLTAKEQELSKVPAFNELFKRNWSLIPEGSNREYKDKAGNIYTTLEKNGVRLAIVPGAALLEKRGDVLNAIGSGNDVTIEFIGMDKERREQGLSKGAFLLRGLRELTDIADKNKIKLFTYPVQLEEDGLTSEQLTSLYKKHGFELGNRVKVMVRNPLEIAVTNDEIQNTVENDPAKVKSVEEVLSRVFKGDYKNGVLTLKDPSTGQKMTYKVVFNSGIDGLAHADYGVSDAEDTIVLNPERLALVQQSHGEKFDLWSQAMMIEEAIHLETVRAWREQGKDISEELAKVADGMSKATRRAHARLYFANQGYDLSNPDIQLKINALAADDNLIAFEAIRQTAQFNLTGTITEQLGGLTEADIARVRAIAKETLFGETNKNMFETIASYLGTMLTALKTKFGITTEVRLSMREAIQNAIARLNKTQGEITKLAEQKEPQAPPFQGSPAQPTSLGVFASYDLRVNRLIESHLDNESDGVLGVTAENDLFRTVDKNDWLFALDQAAKNGIITNTERTLYRAASLDSLINGRVALALVPTKAIETGEAMETGMLEGTEGAIAIPSDAFVPIQSVKDTPVTDSKIQEKEMYRFTLRGYPSEKTFADTLDQALSQGVIKLLSNREKVTYEGRDYDWTRRGALIRELQRRGAKNYVSKVKITPQVSEPRMVESQAMKNLLEKYGDNFPDVSFKEKFLGELYNASVSMEQQFEDARQYIEENGGWKEAVVHYLSNSMNTSMPIQAAVGFELLRTLGPLAKTDKYARDIMAKVMLVQKQRYGTDPGRTVQLWSALSDMSDNPEAMRLFVHGELAQIAAGRLAPYKEDIDEVGTALKEAGRIASERVATSPQLESTIDKIAKLIEKNIKEQNFEGIDRGMYDFVSSDTAKILGDAFLGSLAVKPKAAEVPGSDADEIRLAPERIKNLGTLIAQIVNSSENPDALHADPETIRSLLYLTKSFRDNPNQAEVRRLVELYFNAAYSYSLAIREAAKRGIELAPAPAITRGEAAKQVVKDKIKAEQNAPIQISSDIQDELSTYAPAAAEALERLSKKSQLPPAQKEFIDEFARLLRSDMTSMLKQAGGLQPKYEKPAPPTGAEVLRDRIHNIEAVRSFIDEVRDILMEKYKGREAELEGIWPYIENAWDVPFSLTSFSKTIKSLASIGGPKVNVRDLIRSSKGDIEAFENMLGELLTKNTNLDAAQIKLVNDYLRKSMATFLKEERTKELNRIKKRLEDRKAGKKARQQVSSALTRLVDAANLGVLKDEILFADLRTQLGLPEMTAQQLDHLNKMIDDLPNYPKGRVRDQKISKMYEYVKLLAPMTVIELLTNYQSMNLLLAFGTSGINAFSSLANNIAQASIIGARGAIKTVTGTVFNKPEETIRGIGYMRAALEAFKPLAFWDKNGGIAWKAAKEIFLKGDFSNVQSVTSMEMGGINMFEAFTSQLDAYLKKHPGAVKPEITIKTPGFLEWIGLQPEYTFSLANKYAYSKFNPVTVGPFILFGRLMAMGDAINTISAKKLYQTGEAYNIAIKKGAKTLEEAEKIAARYLNSTPEARRRAEARATEESKELNYTPYQWALRVEEILEQERPQDEVSRDLIKRTEKFAERSNFRNNFEGVLGAAAASAVTLSNIFPPAKFVLKYLRTGSSLGNAALDIVPVLGTLRYYNGIGNFDVMRKTKFFVPPAQKDTVDRDIALGKLWLSYIIGAGLLAMLRKALNREPDPDFNIHIGGPKDPAQRKAFYAAGGKNKSLQIGSFEDGNPRFISFESLPPFLAGMLIPLGAFTEAIRYEKRSKQEAIIPTLAAASWMTIYAMLDYAFLSGIRGLLQLASPGNGNSTSTDQLTNIVKFTGNVASTLLPGYASLRDIEKLVEGIYGLPTARLYQDSFLSVFLASVPFASKVGEPALDFLGGSSRAKFWNSVPFIRRLMTTGVDTSEYAQGIRTDDAIHDKLISLFAKNQTALDWEAGPLKIFATAELATKPTVGVGEILALKRELTESEKYDWMKRAYPYIIQSLGGNIDSLQSLQPEEFKYVVGELARPFMKMALYEVLAEKNQQGIIQELSPDATNVLPSETK